MFSFLRRLEMLLTSAADARVGLTVAADVGVDVVVGVVFDV